MFSPFSKVTRRTSEVRLKSGHGSSLDLSLTHNIARRQSELDIYEAQIDTEFKRRLLISQPEIDYFDSRNFDANAQKQALGLLTSSSTDEEEEESQRLLVDRDAIEASNQLANTAIVGIISIEKSGKILYSNSKAQEIFQYPSLTGASIHDFVPDSFGGQNFKKKHIGLVEAFFDRPFGGGRMLDPGIILRAQLKSGKLVPLNIGLEAKLNPATRKPIAVLAYIVEAGAVIDQSKVEKMLARATLVVLQQFVSQFIFSVISFVEIYQLEPLRYGGGGGNQNDAASRLQKCLQYSYNNLSGESGQGKEDYKMLLYVISTAVTIAISVLPLYINHLHDEGEEARENGRSLWARREFIRYVANQINDIQEYLSTLRIFREKDVVTVAVVATTVNLALLYKINTVPGEYSIDSLSKCERSVTLEINFTTWMSIVGIVPIGYLLYKLLYDLYHYWDDTLCVCCFHSHEVEEKRIMKRRDSEVNLVNQLLLHKLISKISVNAKQEYQYLHFLHQLDPPVTTMQELVCYYDRLENETQRHEFIFTDMMKASGEFNFRKDHYKFEFFEHELIKAHRGFLYRIMKNEKLKKDFEALHPDSPEDYVDLKGSRHCPFSSAKTSLTAAMNCQHQQGSGGSSIGGEGRGRDRGEGSEGGEEMKSERSHHQQQDQHSIEINDYNLVKKEVINKGSVYAKKGLTRNMSIDLDLSTNQNSSCLQKAPSSKIENNHHRREEEARSETVDQVASSSEVLASKPLLPLLPASSPSSSKNNRNSGSGGGAREEEEVSMEASDDENASRQQLLSPHRQSKIKADKTRKSSAAATTSPNLNLITDQSKQRNLSPSSHQQRASRQQRKKSQNRSSSSSNNIEGSTKQPHHDTLPPSSYVDKVSSSESTSYDSDVYSFKPPTTLSKKKTNSVSSAFQGVPLDAGSKF